MPKSVQDRVNAIFQGGRDRLNESRQRLKDNGINGDNLLRDLEQFLVPGPYRIDFSALALTDNSQRHQENKRPASPSHLGGHDADAGTARHKRLKSTASDPADDSEHEDLRFSMLSDREPMDLFRYFEDLGKQAICCPIFRCLLRHADNSRFRFKQTILRSRYIPGYLASDILSAPLKPWQATGVGKLRILSQTPSKGEFLAKPVDNGLGECLTALVSALQIREAEGKRGFVLVVCRTPYVTQWFDEIQKHFKEVWIIQLRHACRGVNPLTIWQGTDREYAG